MPSKRLGVLLLALGGVALVAFLWRPFAPRPWNGQGLPNLTPEEARKLLSALSALEAREREAEERHWAPDLVAQHAGRVFEDLWDTLNAATNKWAALSALNPPEVVAPDFEPPRRRPHRIEEQSPRPGGRRLGPAAWQNVIDAARAAGWEIAQVGFRHRHFQLGAPGGTNQSRFLFEAHLTRAEPAARAALSGEIDVAWETGPSATGLPAIARIDASRVTLRTRAGPPPFERVLDETLAPPEKSHFIDPVIAHDLDGDGRSELLLAARNLVYRWRGWDRIEREPLCRHSPGLILTALVGDFDGDGADDFLCARFEGLLLFRGSGRGTFEEPGQPAWSVTPRLKYGQAFTCGDIDGDGDLDLWLGQYKGPYDRGQMPTPYYDANDGHPAYLLLNDGHGRFTDGTRAAGLEARRWRRSYSGSFVDLDGDHDLDLVVVSDFAGVDLYANDGRGRFTEVTARWVPERHAFGMAHTVADLNGDGGLDLLVMGMTCPTPQRLDALGLSRPEHPEYAAMRPRMAAGNRLFLARTDGGFDHQSPLSRSIARSGWSWGCSAADFDNDGYADVFVATGHESKESVRDYEVEFWRHDIYVGGSQDDLVVSAYFGSKVSRTRGQGESYGGYEKNRVFWNQDGREFLEIGHLLGLAIEQDSRNVLTDDLDGDGRVDVLFTTFEAWPQVRQTVRLYRNRLEPAGHWIGARLASPRPGVSPVGALVTVEAGGRRFARAVITGDAHRTQHAAQVHFGLGTLTQVDRLAVRWPDGTTTATEHPRLNTYHHPNP